MRPFVISVRLALISTIAFLAALSGCPDQAANLGTDGQPAAGQSTPAVQDAVAGPPKLVSAISTSNTSVRVTFSEPMDNSVLSASNYAIVQANVVPEAGSLGVVSATRFGNNGTAITLRTLSQSEVTYELIVTNVRDVAGNEIAPPELLVTPTRTMFAGTPFRGKPDNKCDGSDRLDIAVCTTSSGALDSDCDGLPDSAEQRGWVVTVTLVDGQTVQRDVTSDPFDCDTDGDGLGDAVEKNIGLDPRSDDTDFDQVSDGAEWNDWFTDPTNQDTDGDSLNDSLELDLQTSPTLADTDGDQLNDDVELIERNRNPLVADLPRPKITADDLFLEVDVMYSYTDEEGATQTVEDTQASTFSQMDETRFGTSDTTSNETVLESSESLEATLNFGGADGFGGSVKGGAEFGQTFTDGYSSTVNSESAKSSTQERSRSVSQAFSESENRSITRSIEGARVAANVSVQNAGDIAFSITNIEVSLQQQDRRNANRFIPVAALRLSGASDPTNQPTFNLGPFDPARGPFVFDNAEVFADRVDRLMREPTGLILKVVNFDVLDEFGRNFVFSSQETNDRTAGITIDYGDGSVEKFRVAVNNQFDASGRMLPITMRRALEIIGIDKSSAPGGDTPNADPADPTIRSTYGVATVNDPDQPMVPAHEVLTRVRGVQNDLVGNPPVKRFWAVQTSSDFATVNGDFSDLELRARDDYILLFTQDIDEDGLHFRQEAYYGSSDLTPNTDGDSLSDKFEVCDGWVVTPIPGTPRRVFSNPGLDDTDGDSLLDDFEMREMTDPTLADSDVDALTDPVEIYGGYEIILFDGDEDSLNDNILEVEPYSDAAVIDGGDGIVDATAIGDDVQIIAVGTMVAAGRIVIGPGPNGVIDTVPVGNGDDFVAIVERLVEGFDGVRSTTAPDPMGSDDVLEIDPNATEIAQGTVLISGGLNGVIDTAPEGDEYIRAIHHRLFATDPMNQDTDFDGVTDGREIVLRSNPNRRDAGLVTDRDRDGLYDAEETEGWTVTVYMNGMTTSYHVVSDPDDPDSDHDGLPDVLEWAIRSDPNKRDSDNDGKFDIFEFDPDDQDGYYTADAIAEAMMRCAMAENCSYENPNEEPSDRLRTNVNSDDSDLDTLKDGFEIDTDVIVRLVGNPTPIVVRSLPYRADSDNDTLNDAAEIKGADGIAPGGMGDTLDSTNPLDSDTDDDSRGDALEITQVLTDEAGRTAKSNPLYPDRLVTAEYIDAQVLDDCDAGDGENAGEFAWDFYFDVTGGLQDQYGATSNDFHLDVSDSDLPNPLTFFSGLNLGGADITTNNTFVFVIGFGSTFNANGVVNEDDVAGNDDEVMTFSMDFTVRDFGNYSQTIATTMIQGSGDCNINVVVSYKVE
ncbi:MAG: hypothetical protein H6819_05900 [Phycisphaerales bacterium]|nr:hypothetical protein [Phycisphaerales bacterium]MCB9858646.1 hypothetical protein [Phycisphaerales bacterium]